MDKILCSAPGCNRASRCKKLCQKHYMVLYNIEYQKSSKYKALQKSPKNCLNSARSHATKRGIAWDLSLPQYEKIFIQPCFYCKRFFSECGSGLDRLDATGPYSVANVVRCCGKCNFLKGNYLTSEETLQVIDLLRTLRGGTVWSTD